MPLNPECLVLKAAKRGKIISNSELEKMAKTDPLAAYCVQCARRMGNKLEKFCWKIL